MRRQPNGLFPKLIDDLFLMIEKARAVEIKVVVQQTDDFVEIVGQENLAGSPGMALLHVGQRVLAVEVAQNKIDRGRNHQGLSKLQWVP